MPLQDAGIFIESAQLAAAASECDQANFLAPAMGANAI